METIKVVIQVVRQVDLRQIILHLRLDHPVKVARRRRIKVHKTTLKPDKLDPNAVNFFQGCNKEIIKVLDLTRIIHRTSISDLKVTRWDNRVISINRILRGLTILPTGQKLIG